MNFWARQVEIWNKNRFYMVEGLGDRLGERAEKEKWSEEKKERVKKAFAEARARGEEQVRRYTL